MPKVVHRFAALRGIARNPATPPELLALLCEVQGLAAVVARRGGDLPDAVVEAVIEHDNGGAAAALAVRSRLPEWALHRLTGHPDDAVREYVACPPRRGGVRPLDVLRLLCGDPSGRVRAAVARNPVTPTDLRQVLATDPDPAVRAETIRCWPGPPPARHRSALTDPDPTVRRAALSAELPPPPADLVAALLADPETTACTLPRITPTRAQLEVYRRSADGEVRLALARMAVPVDVLERLAADDLDDVRGAVALNHATPQPLRDTVVATLRTDPVEHFLDCDPPGYTLFGTWLFPGPAQRPLLAATQTPAAPEDLAVLLAGATPYLVEEAAADHALPPAWMHALVHGSPLADGGGG